MFACCAGEVVQHMPYVDAVIKEVLRLKDPASVVFRRALQDIIIDDNLVIPKVRSPKGARHPTFEQSLWQFCQISQT